MITCRCRLSRRPGSTRRLWRRRGPRVVLHFHLTGQAIRHGNIGLVRPEHGDPQTVDRLVEFLAATGCQIRVQPVLDPAGTAPIDGYEISPRLRAAVR
jgi:hypothetical protein